MAFWNDLRVVVTTGTGFLGSRVAEEVRERGCPQVVVARRSEYDLRQSHAVTALLR